VQAEDELGELARSFAVMQERLRASDEQVRGQRRRRRIGWAGLALLALLGGGLYVRGLYRERDAARRSAEAERTARRAEERLVATERQRTRAERERASALEDRRRLAEAWDRERRQLLEDLGKAEERQLREHILRRLQGGPPAVAAAPASRPLPVPPRGVSLCLFGPAPDLRLHGEWVARLGDVRAKLIGAGYRIGCEYPYVRSSARFRTAVSGGELQHAGLLPAGELEHLERLLRELYPRLTVRRVPARQLFRAVDLLIPE